MKVQRSITRALACITALGLGLVFSGCSTAQDDGNNEGSTGNTEENVSLRVVVYTSNPDQLALLDSIADDFKAEHENVDDITFESIDVGDLDTKLTAELSSSDPPDMSWLTVANSGRYISADALLDLAPTLKSVEGYDYDDLVDTFLARWKDGDALYGMPFSTSTQVLFYNADVFKKSDLPTPKEMMDAGTWDWKHLREASKKVTEDQGIPGYSVDYSGSELLFSLMYAFDASPWNEEGDTCTLDSPEMNDALSLFHGMIYDDGSTTEPGQIASFFDGSAGTEIAYLSRVSLLKDASFEWGVVPTPAGPDGFHPAIGQSAFVGFNASKNPKTTAEFIAFLTNLESSKKLSKYWLSARESLLTPEALHETQPLISEDEYKMILDGTLDSGELVPVAKNGGGAQESMLDVVDEFVYEKNVNMEEALKKACGKLQPVLQ